MFWNIIWGFIIVALILSGLFDLIDWQINIWLIVAVFVVADCSVQFSDYDKKSGPRGLVGYRSSIKTAVRFNSEFGRNG